MKWLSAMASRFEHYEILSAKIEWCSSHAPPAGGPMAMSVDYDVLDNTPVDFLAMLNGSNVVNGAIWDNHALTIRPGNIVPKRKFVRNGFSAPALSDSRLYDAFDFHFYATGAAAGIVTVEYTVKFTTPQILEGGSEVAASDGAAASAAAPTVFHPTVAATKTGLSSPIALRTATEEEIYAGSMPAGSAVIETKPNWEGVIDCLTDNTAGSECSISSMYALSSLYPDTHFIPEVSALEDVLFGTDGRSARSYRVKTSNMPGLLYHAAVNAAEQPSFEYRASTGAYSSLI